MNEVVNLLNLTASGNNSINLNVSNISGQETSINVTGIKNLNLNSLEKIYINTNEYKQISINQDLTAKLIGNESARTLLNNLSWVSQYSDPEDLVSQGLTSGLYVNGIKFIPTQIIIDGVTKTVLAAEE